MEFLILSFSSIICHIWSLKSFFFFLFHQPGCLWTCVFYTEFLPSGPELRWKTKRHKRQVPYPQLSGTSWSSRNETCINFNLYLSWRWPPSFQSAIGGTNYTHHNSDSRGTCLAIRKLTWLCTTGGFKVSQHNYTIVQPDELWLVAGVWQLSWRGYTVCHIQACEISSAE